VLVTGGARGIGAATASAAAAMGAAVVLVDRLGDVLSHTAASIALSGGHVATVVGDVRDPATVEATVDLAIGRFGRIDGVVNNAGGGFWAPFERVSAKGQAALVDENFTQVTHVVRAALPHLGRGASIVNVTSIEAHRAGPGFALYSAMKAAVENLSKSLALELAARGIRVNCVAPDMIPTPGDEGLAADSGALLDDAYSPQPLDGPGQPEDVAHAICYLLTDLARFVTGSTIHVDGGTFAASGWRRRLADDSYSL
jgi:3-oxoacyl-[acyl-carrier protein] reductase